MNHRWEVESHEKARCAQHGCGVVKERHGMRISIDGRLIIDSKFTWPNGDMEIRENREEPACRGTSH